MSQYNYFFHLKNSNLQNNLITSLTNLFPMESCVAIDPLTICVKSNQHPAGFDFTIYSPYITNATCAKTPLFSVPI